MNAATKLYRKFVLRDLKRNFVLTVLTCSGVALGVAVVLSVSLANYSVLDRFSRTVKQISGEANLEIRPRNSDFMPQDFLEHIRWLWQANARFTPIFEAEIVLNNSDKTMVPLLGVDLLAEPDFTNYQISILQSGTKVQAVNSAQLPTLLEPYTALVPISLAKRHNLREGTELQIISGGETKRLKIAGLLSESNLGSAYSGTFILVDISTAQALLGKEGKISLVSIIAPNEAVDDIAQQLRETLPQAVSVQEPAHQVHQLKKMTRSFEGNLFALTLISLVVGMFLVYNTMTMNVIRRRPDIGVLRALGASRLDILLLFMAGATTIGTVGSLGGVAFGVLFAEGVLNAIASTLQHFYVRHPLERISLDPSIVVLPFLLGVLATVIATLPPALESASVPPAVACRRSSFDRKVVPSAKPLVLAALVFISLGVLLSFAPPVADFPLLGYGAAVLFIVGFSLLVSPYLRATLPVLTWIFEKLRIVEARLATCCLRGAIGRASVATASLMVALAMMISLSIMIASFRQTVVVWVNQTFKADLWMQTVAHGRGVEADRMSPAVIDELKAVDGVLAVDGFIDYPIEYRGEPCRLAGADLDIVAKRGFLQFTSGENTSAVLTRLGPGECIISEAFSLKKHASVGDIISLATPSGNLSLHVAAIYYEYSSDLGYIIIRRSTFAKQFGDPTVSSVAIYLKPYLDIDSVRSRIISKVGNHVSVLAIRELRSEALRIFDQTFAITYALYAIAILVAVLAITSTLFSLSEYFKRDYAVLSCLGASLAQLRKIIFFESLILGIAGYVLSTLLGCVLSLLLIYVINRQSFGWTVQLVIPSAVFLNSFVLVIFTSLAAAIYPAFMVGKIEASAAAIREE